MRLRNLNPFARIRDLEERVATLEAIEASETYAWYPMPPRHEASEVDGVDDLWTEASSEYAVCVWDPDADTRSNLYL